MSALLDHDVAHGSRRFRFCGDPHERGRAQLDVRQYFEDDRGIGGGVERAIGPEGAVVGSSRKGLPFAFVGDRQDRRHACPAAGFLDVPTYGGGSGLVADQQPVLYRDTGCNSSGDRLPLRSRRGAM